MIGRTNAGLAPLRPKYSIKGWTQTIGLSYSDLSAISEIDMRLLMSKHASVDYFMEWYASDNAMLDIFTQNAFAMKWIGLNDYIADKLLAISDAESRLLASPYWEYILKDHVPIMTANDAPYGEVIGLGSTDMYKIFDGDDTSFAKIATTNSFSGQWVGYKFTNPIIVKKIAMSVPTSATLTLVVEGSNDNSTWETLSDDFTLTDANGKKYVPLNNDTPYLMYRVYLKSSTNNQTYSVYTLQFYGRSLNVSVPTMTSNTQPYGEVISNGTPYAPSSSEPQLPYEAFDNKTTTGTWLYTTDGTKPYVGYDFKKEIVLKYASILANGGSSESLPHTSRFETSLDGEHWFPFGADVVRNNTSNATDIRTDISGVKCRYVRNVVVDTPTVSGKTRTLAILKMNFFGVDYSDRTERTYLYDHGVEVVPMQTYSNGNNASVTKEADCLHLVDNNGSAFCLASNESLIDVTPYKLVRCVIGDVFKISLDYKIAMSITRNDISSWSSFASKDIGTNIPYNEFLDISSINESVRIGFLSSSYNNGVEAKLTELWLE